MKFEGEPQGGFLLGALITALRELPWKDEAQAQKIASSLGFGLIAPIVGQDQFLEGHAQSSVGPVTMDASLTLAQLTTVVSDPNFPISQATENIYSKRASSPTSSKNEPTHWLPEYIRQTSLIKMATRISVVPAPGWLRENFQILEPSAQVSPVRKALLPDLLARGVISAALGTQREGNELDLPVLLRGLAKCHLPRKLPRQRSASLAHGCQLILDFSDTMLPWWEDLRDLRRQVTGVVGKDGVTVFEFDQNPAQATEWSLDDQERTWQPVAGCPILVATDFGVQSYKSKRKVPDYWRLFINRCAAMFCPLLVLTPWRPDSLPKGLGSYPKLIHWHQRTTAAMVRYKLRHSFLVRS